MAIAPPGHSQLREIQQLRAGGFLISKIASTSTAAPVGSCAKPRDQRRTTDQHKGLIVGFMGAPWTLLASGYFAKSLASIQRVTRPMVSRLAALSLSIVSAEVCQGGYSKSITSIAGIFARRFSGE